MNLNVKRIAVLCVLTFIPAAALAAAAATGADGGMCASLMSLFDCSSGCPNAAP